MNIEEQRAVISELQGLAKSPFFDWGTLGNITAREKWYDDDVCYILLNYNGLAGRKAPWNKYEQVCRGLILEYRTGKVIAWPFEKFFNVGEHDRKPIGRLVNVSEKLDGSLGIMYRDPLGNPCIATRGSFDSDHAVWASNFLERWHASAVTEIVPGHVTLLFEIISPEFRNVIEYPPDRTGLVLLAGRNRKTGEYLPMYPDIYMIGKRCGFEVARPASANSIKELLERAGSLPHDEEGWVIEMSNGERWKIKGDEYIELHRIIHSISLKRALDAFGQEETYTAYLPSDVLPEEHEDRWSYYIDMLNNVLANHFHKGRTFYEERPESSNDDRRQFAEWVFSNKDRAKYSAFLFALYDNATLGRLDQIVLKMMRRQYKNGELDWIENNYELQNV